MGYRAERLLLKFYENYLRVLELLRAKYHKTFLLCDSTRKMMIHGVSHCQLELVQ
jgi:hypothetical protein